MSQLSLAAQASLESPPAMLCVVCSLQSMQTHLLCHSAASTEGKQVCQVNMQQALLGYMAILKTSV